jgi:hypothetical protein
LDIARALGALPLTTLAASVKRPLSSSKGILRQRSARRSRIRLFWGVDTPLSRFGNDDRRNCIRLDALYTTLSIQLDLSSALRERHAKRDAFTGGLLRAQH